MQVGVDVDGDDSIDGKVVVDTVEVVRGMPMPLELPPRVVSVVELTLIKPLDDLTRRPDLALSSLDIRVESDRVRGEVHNIGGAPANCTLALVDKAGSVHDRLELGQLEAPLDLVPRRLPFEFELPGDGLNGWSLVVDPDGEVAELYEGNNRVELARVTATRDMIEEVRAER